jgi:hypothetical protein
MVEYVFIGRRRDPWRIIVLGILTFGIYGRMTLYRQVKEIDGHRAMFLDLRIIVLLLWLPVVGPFMVKMRLRRLLGGLMASDITHTPPNRRAFFWSAWVPIIPVFVAWAQAHLNVYWRRQARIEDLRHKREQLESLSKGRMTPQKEEAIKALEGQIARRARALQDEEEAARAIIRTREEMARAEEEVEEEIKAIRRERLKAKFSIRRKPAEEGESEDGPARSGFLDKVKSRVPTGWRRGERKPDEGAETSADAEAGAAADEPRESRSRFPWRRKAKPDEEAPATDDEPPTKRRRARSQG